MEYGLKEFKQTLQKTAQHLQAELVRTRWHYDQALVEQQHNAELTLAETRMVLEHEHNVRIKKLIRLHEEERERALEEVKKKQWVRAALIAIKQRCHFS